MSRLKGGKPRRYPDHRKVVARPYNAAYGMIAERFPPRDRLACQLTGMAADLVLDYEALRRSRTGKAASPRRKTVGLLLGLLRVAANGANGGGADDLNAALADLHRGGNGHG